MPNADETYPFDEGIEARRKGKPRSKCPYPIGTDESEDWLEGWDDAGAPDEGLPS